MLLNPSILLCLISSGDKNCLYSIPFFPAVPFKQEVMFKCMSIRGSLFGMLVCQYAVDSKEKHKKTITYTASLGQNLKFNKSIQSALTSMSV